MSGVNKAIIVGRLGKDPEIKYSAAGSAVVNFSVATSETWNDKTTGEKQEKTEWHRVVAFGRLAEICGQYLAKGRQVYIEGRLQTREWIDNDGGKRWTTEIIADQMQMLGDRAGNDQAPPQKTAPPPRNVGKVRTAMGYQTPGPTTDPGDDIPF